MKRKLRASRQTTRHATREQFHWEKERKREMHNAHGCSLAVFTSGFFRRSELFFSIQEHIEFFLDRLYLPKNLCPGGKISIACVTPFFILIHLSLFLSCQSSTQAVWTVCVHCALPKYVPYVCTAYLKYVGLLLFFDLFRFLRSFTAHHFFRRSNLILCCVLPKKIFKNHNFLLPDGGTVFGKINNSSFFCGGSWTGREMKCSYSFSKN